MSTRHGVPPTRQSWLAAMRPRTLPLATASIILGTAMAAAHDRLRWPVAFYCLLTAVLLQILSNLANDYGDSVHGADHVARLGPSRAVQSGAITPRAMKLAIAASALLAIASGLMLLWSALEGGTLLLFVVFAVLGATAVLAAITYTAGFKPYGYAGLGDLAVLVFFGWIGVVGTYFLQALRWDWTILLPATSCGLLAVAVLNVNNIRDIESDRQAGKRSIPVRIGPYRARQYHWLLLGTATGTALLYALVQPEQSLWRYLFLMALPLLWRNGTAVWHTEEPRQLNPWLKQLSLVTLAFVLLFGLGQVFA